MIDKYKDKFEEMYEKMNKGEEPVKVLNEYMNFFENENMGAIGIAYYLSEYIKKNKGSQNSIENLK
jgi:hypothetical protein